MTLTVNRRTLLKTGGLATVGALTIGAGPCSGPSKEKAVRVAGFIIDLSKESLPLLELLGARDVAETVRDKAIPALDKLKDVLAGTDIPAMGTALTTVRNILSGVANALLNLPANPRRTTVIGILASINVLLLTVQAFVESEMTSGVSSVAALSAPNTGATMLRVFEATRQ
jgi:hypothetical protein